MKGSIEAHTLYDDGTKMPGNYSIEKPEISFGSTDITGGGIMGTISLPSLSQLESMQMTLNFRGVSKEQAQLFRPGNHSLEARAVQSGLGQDGKSVKNFLKTYANGFLKSFSGGSLEAPSPNENSAVYEVTRYQEFVDGVETLLIDKINHQYRVLGVDYSDQIYSGL